MTDDLQALRRRLDALEHRVAVLEASPRIEMPTEPLFDLRAAAMFVPMGYNALRMFLSRHKAEFPARYRFQGSGHRKIRLLSASEIRKIREYVVWTLASRRARAGARG